MGMKATDTGIDWDRVQPEDYDLLAAYADEAASEPCDGRRYPTRSYAYDPDHSGYDHYTTIGGEVKCLARARDSWQGRLPREVREALKRALGTKRSDIFAAQVTTLEIVTSET